jgi:phosphatidylserine/phosphatidylglycerophosphate/cardiolipin synthase-like enzyme
MIWQKAATLFLAGLLPLACLADEPVQIDMGSAQAGFSTDGSAKRLVLDVINGARKNIRVLAYSFTSKDIATALVAAARRGVDVKVVVDSSQQNGRYSFATFLANMGVAVRVDHRHAIQHQKVLIADDDTVETGSFNYTDSADRRNAENVLVVKNSARLAGQYLREWELHWAHSDVLKPNY